VKILTMAGTRPEVIRLSSTIKKLDNLVDHKFVHTGQNFSPEMRDVFYDDLDLRLPDAQWQIPDSSLSGMIGTTMSNLEAEIKNFKPDALVMLGDTNSALAGLIARRMGVITYHIEAGNRSFDENVPEEINRRIIDHFSDFNLAYSQNALQNLLNEGLHPRRLLLCGSPMREVIESISHKLSSQNVLSKFTVKPREFFLVSAHRQENVDDPLRLLTLVQSLDKLFQKYRFPILVSMHPRTRMKIDDLGIQLPEGIISAKPFGFLDYLVLQMNAFCVLSDSGTISEESAILNFPAITIRDSIERPEALETGSIMMSGLEFENIDLAVQIATLAKSPINCPDAYAVEDHSDRVVKFIISTLPRANEWFGIRS